MTCSLCQNSFYPPSLSGHRWIPNEPEDHRDERFSIQQIEVFDHFIGDQGQNALVYIPRYPKEDNTRSPTAHRIPKSSDAYLVVQSIIKPIVEADGSVIDNSVNRVVQASLRRHLESHVTGET